MMTNVEDNEELACMLDQVQLCPTIQQSWKLPFEHLMHYWTPVIMSILSVLTVSVVVA